MSIHWKSLNKGGKVAAIKAVYEPGMTARDIASHFDGVTRNAIIGIYTRYPEELASCRLPGQGGRPPKVAQREKTVSLPAQFFKGKAGQKPRREAPAVDAESRTCGRPIIALDDHQCRWPVNDAEPGELHLFCGLPTEGIYCEHHASRAFRALDIHGRRAG